MATLGRCVSARDGRPTPLTAQQVAEKEKQYNLAKRIVELVGELETAKANHAKRVQEQQAKRQEILSQKFKPKSDQL